MSFPSATPSFTPASLATIPSPPGFNLHPVTRADRKRFRREVMVEGLRFHDTAAFRAEFRKAHAALWSPDVFAEMEPRITAYWAASDRYSIDTADIDDAPAFAHPDREAMEELFGRAREAWEPLRAMAADNIAFHADSPSIMLAVLLDGWSNLDVPYGRAAGIVTLDRLEQVEAALEAIERDPAYKDVEGIDPGLAWLQLCAEAARLLFPPREVLKAAA